MTTEKMTVHKALCELKTLDARIQKSIQQGTFVFQISTATTRLLVSASTLTARKSALHTSLLKTSSLAAMLLSVQLRCPTLLSR